MSVLIVSPTLKEFSSIVGAHGVSTIYFARHCGKHALVVQHEVTFMLVFGRNDELNPDFIKCVSSKGIAVKGTQIVGNGDLVLLLDDAGRLWKMINAFEHPSGEEQRLHLLDESCFYEWVPFKKFNFEKILAISAWGNGFACLGTSESSDKKLVLLPSADSHFVKDYTFQEIRCTSSLNFCLTNVTTSDKSTSKNDSEPAGETLLITDRFTGKTYQCSQDGTHSLINYSNNFLVSMLHFEQEKCLLLAFQNGKLVFHFLNGSAVHCVLYLPKQLSLMEKCCCLAPCLLWSDGLSLHHTKLIFHPHEHHVKLFHFKLQRNIQNPSRFVKLGKHVLVVTVNNIYYRVSPGPAAADGVQRSPDQLLSEISKGSLTVHHLNKEIDLITHFLHSKQILDRTDTKDKVEMSVDRDCLVIRLRMNVILSRDFWKVRLAASCPGKKCVKMAGLETDVSEGVLVRIENPFKSKRKISVSFVGDFAGERLFLDLGEVGESEESAKNELPKDLERILARRKMWLMGAERGRLIPSDPAG